MKNHVTEQDLKPDSPLPFAIAVQFIPVERGIVSTRY